MTVVDDSFTEVVDATADRRRVSRRGGGGGVSGGEIDGAARRINGSGGGGSIRRSSICIGSISDGEGESLGLMAISIPFVGDESAR